MFLLLIQATLRSMMLFGAVWLLLRLIRLRDLRTEKLIWTVVLVASLAMPIMMTSFALTLPIRALPPGLTGKLEVLTTEQTMPFGLERGGLAMYVVITLILLARFVRGLMIARGVHRSAQRLPASLVGPIEVRASNAVRAPMSFGSTILLPGDWDLWEGHKFRAVMAHESEHIRERDCYRLWLVTLYSTFFWFNPCAIWLRRRLTVLAEMISDEAGVAVMGSRIGYAEVLVDIATEAQLPRVAVAMALPATLTERLTRLMETDMPTKNLRRTHKMALLAGVMLTTAISAVGATAPLVLTDAQDSAVKWVSGQPLSSFYPKDLQKQGVQAQVICRVTIDAKGRVTKVVATKSDESHPELAIAAVRAVKTFRFNNTLSRPVIKMLAVRFALT